MKILGNEVLICRGLVAITTTGHSCFVARKYITETEDGVFTQWMNIGEYSTYEEALTVAEM